MQDIKVLQGTSNLAEPGGGEVSGEKRCELFLSRCCGVLQT